MAQLPADMAAELKKAILANFSQKDQLEPVTRQARSKSVDQLALGTNLDVIVDKLIRLSEDEGWLGDFLRALCDARPGSPELKDFNGQWRAAATATVVDHFTALMLPGRRVLIDRQPLRSALKSLLDIQGARVLVVDGEDESGKSYTVQYVGYLREVLASFQFAAVDLERVRRNRNNKVDAMTLGDAVSNALIGETYSPPKDDNLTTWIDSYCDWLRRKLPTVPLQWLVIDSFRKVGLEQNAYDLIAALAMRTYRELSALRLALLSYRDVDWLKARVIGAVEYEWIAPIDRNHLARFFSQLCIEHYKRLGQTLDQPVVMKQIAEATQRVLLKAAATSSRRLEAIGRTAWDEAEIILKPAMSTDTVDEVAELAKKALALAATAAGEAPTDGAGP